MKNILDRFKKLFSSENRFKAKCFFDKYRNYFYAGGLFVILLVTLFFFTGEEAIARRLAELNSQTVSGEKYVPDKEFEVDAYPEINALITQYFTAYVNADFATLEKLATPVSDMEKSYIAVMSQYYESYNNIKCYSKHGLSKDSYIVTVCFDIKFYEQEVVAPSFLTFYIQTNVDGNLYINNLYSNFNLKYSELAVNNDIYTALRKYVTQDDYIALHMEVTETCNTLMKENKDIHQLIKRTIPVIRQEWEDAVYYAEDTSTEGIENTIGTEGGQSTENTETQTPPTETQVETQQPEPQPEPEPEPPVVKVRALDTVNIRTTASSAGDLIRTSEEGEIFVKLGEVDGWTKVQVDEDTVGYMNSYYLEEVTE